jgi:hypothetical protein
LRARRGGNLAATRTQLRSQGPACAIHGSAAPNPHRGLTQAAGMRGTRSTCRAP